MDRFFDSNNPLMRILSRMVDLAVLNIMTLVFSLPIVTIGASLTAMNFVLLHMRRGEETYVWKMFLQSFRENLKQGIPLGLIYVVYAAAVAADLMILHMMDSRAATWLMLFITFVSFIVLVSAVYACALQARFENTIRGTLANAWKLMIGNLLQSALMLIIWVLWCVVMVLWHKAAGALFLLFGLSIPGLLCTILYDPIFRRLEKRIEKKLAERQNDE